MTSPFENDMFAMVYQAFKNLYPDKEPHCEWVSSFEKSEDGLERLGMTTFAEDGEIYVEICGSIKVTDAVEIFAHELAHVAVGGDKGHEEEWEEAFDRIFDEYNRIGNEMFDFHQPIKIISGKDYVREEEKGGGA